MCNLLKLRDLSCWTTPTLGVELMESLMEQVEELARVRVVREGIKPCPPYILTHFFSCFLK